VDQPLSLAALRGRVVLLHFWAFSCVNCLRVLAELRRLELRFPDELVVVGVHSPRLPREADHEAVLNAVARHHVLHPVLDDPDLATWSQYGIRAWPSLVLIDPEGYVAAEASGEGHGRALERAVAELVAEHEAKATLAVDPLDLDPAMPPPGPLAFPGKVAASGDGRRLAIADTGHEQVLVCSLDGLVLEVHTGLSQPQGVRFDGDVVVVCDTGADRVVRTDGVVVADGIASPWDLVFDEDSSVVVAEAGRHRLRRVRPGEQRVLVAAGRGAEGNEDGPAAQALLAQPSGVARVAEGLVFVDAEANALRVLDRSGQVATLVGRGLQHPLGVAADAAGGRLYVADTFNSLLRVWEGGALRTLPATGLEEPGGIDVLPDGRLVVADTNHHRVVIADPESGAVQPLELDESWVMSSIGNALTAVAGQPLRVPAGVDLTGEEVDHSSAEPVRVTVEARPASLLSRVPVRETLQAPDADVEVRAGQPGRGFLLVEVAASTRRDGRRAVRVDRRRHQLDVLE
jgi:thiol-disulfide isomerase/thioredoxin